MSEDKIWNGESLLPKTPEPPVELMYRPPGETEHRNITDVLDEIMIRLQSIEEFCDQVAEIENANYGGTD